MAFFGIFESPIIQRGHLDWIAANVFSERWVSNMKNIFSPVNALPSIFLLCVTFWKKTER